MMKTILLIIIQIPIKMKKIQIKKYIQKKKILFKIIVKLIKTKMKNQIKRSL